MVDYNLAPIGSDIAGLTTMGGIQSLPPLISLGSDYGNIQVTTGPGSYGIGVGAGMVALPSLNTVATQISNMGGGGGGGDVNVPPPATVTQPPAAGFPSDIPQSWLDSIIAAVSGLGITIPEPVTTALGILGAGYLGYQAFQGITGGGEQDMTTGITSGGLPVPIGGPGLAEPGKPYLIKEWHVSYPKGRAQYYLVQNMSASGRKTRYVMMYKTWDKTWDWWRLPKPHLAVIGKNMPSHKQLTRLRRNLSRHTADAKTILKVSSPATYAKLTGYKKYSRRRR